MPEGFLSKYRNITIIVLVIAIAILLLPVQSFIPYSWSLPLFAVAVIAHLIYWIIYFTYTRGN